MTTIQKVFDAVKVRYMRESANRKVPQTELENGEFKLMYDIVQHEIFRKLNITDDETEITITPVTVFTEYALPTNFGGLRSFDLVFSNARVGLELKDRTELVTSGTLVQGSPTKIAIYAKSDGKYYAYLSPISGFTGTLTIRYKLLYNIADGGGAGEDFSTATVLPVAYKHLLLHGIMGELFSDMKEQYYQYLQDAKGDRPIPVKATMNYNLGFDEEGYNQTNLGI